jgi:hypothetical protein
MCFEGLTFLQVELGRVLIADDSERQICFEFGPYLKGRTENVNGRFTYHHLNLQSVGLAVEFDSLGYELV